MRYVSERVRSAEIPAKVSFYAVLVQMRFAANSFLPLLFTF